MLKEKIIKRVNIKENEIIAGSLYESFI